MAGKSKRVPGQVVRCTQCGEGKPWAVGPFKGEHGKPRQPCAPCDTKRRGTDAKSNVARERSGGVVRTARWRAKHPEKVQAANARPRVYDKAKARERNNRWRRAHQDRRVGELSRRNARKRQLPASWAVADWRRCLAYWNDRCCVCGRAAGDGYVIAQEHWIPIADKRPGNPGTVPQNMLPMCHGRRGATDACNTAKAAKDPRAWLIARLGHSAAGAVLSAIGVYFEALQQEARS